ncbi:hypothetical protein [Haladaptatus sp. CMAA 1911]|uniref:hypothetical protein n=1 Tax=unclassified Haladaptatus TaxID=2622732 RepID=UPI003754AAAC
METNRFRIAPTMNRIVTGQMFQYISFILLASALIGPALPGIPIASYYLFFFRLFAMFIYIPILAYGLVFKKIASIRVSRAGMYLLILYSYLVVSFVWADDKLAAVSELFILSLAFLVMASIIITVRSERTLEKYFTVLSLIALLSIGIAGWEHFTQHHLTVSRVNERAWYYQDKMSAWYYNRNDYSFFLTMFSSIPLVNALFPNDDKKYRMFNLAIFVAILAIITENGSRAAIVAVFVVVFTCISLYYARPFIRHYQRQIYGVFTFLAFLGATIVVVLVIEIGNPIGQSSSPSLWARWQLIKGGLKLAFQTIFGAGVGNFTPAVRNMSIPTGGIGSPHGWLTWALGTVGLPGTILFLLAYGRILDDLFFEYLNTGGPLLMMLFASLLSFTIGGIGPSDVIRMSILWVFFGLAIASTSLVRSR